AGQVASVSPFAGNVVPQNRIHPTSARVMRDYYPLPNRGFTVEANNFLNTEGRRSDSDQWTGRVDWLHTTNSNFMFRYSHGNELQYIPREIPDQGNNADVKVRQGVLGHTWVMGANKVNEFKFGISRLEGANIQQRAFRENVVQALNIPD